MNGIAAEIGKELKEARLATGLTQVELAEEIDLTFSTYNQIERGRRAAPIKTLERIAERLGRRLKITLEPIDNQS